MRKSTLDEGIAIFNAAASFPQQCRCGVHSQLSLPAGLVFPRCFAVFQFVFLLTYH